MLRRRPKYVLLALVVAVAAAAVGAFLLLQPKDKPVARMLTLPDGSEVYFWSDTVVEPAPGYPQPRELRIDGEVYLRAASHPENLLVRTGLLNLTVTGPGTLRIIAHADEAGEQAEVVEGQVEARKSYPSPYSEPDLLTAGGMVLINRDIDLMEKETCDVKEIRAWGEALIAAVRAQAQAESVTQDGAEDSDRIGSGE